MSIIKVLDVAHVRFAVPDLDLAQSFLSEFGFLSVREDNAVYSRGLGAAPYLHVAHQGPPKFVGFAFEAASVADLEKLAAAEGVEVGPLHGPGGGRLVKLSDPDGFRVEVVAGREPAPLIAPRPVEAMNQGAQRARLNTVKRVGRGASQVLRLGHVVLKVSDFRRSEAWYKQRFGLITSDEVETEPGNAIGAFLRADRGSVPSDHHTLFLLGTGSAQFDHAAFEVPDFDDLMRGHAHLAGAKHRHSWGVGRHILGSQVFDYWQDPWGNVLEHWTDGDVMDAAWGSRKAPVEHLLGVQWGQSFHEAHPGDEKTP